ncbi:MAG: hypothetical protein SOZ07_06755 [Prevotella sp.]|nr:hypothetical protein [Prevotella sp.]
MDQVAQRAQCTRLTLLRLEKGEPTVSLGVVMRVLNALTMFPSQSLEAVSETGFFFSVIKP